MQVIDEVVKVPRSVQRQVPMIQEMQQDQSLVATFSVSKLQVPVRLQVRREVFVRSQRQCYHGTDREEWEMCTSRSGVAESEVESSEGHQSIETQSTCTIWV